MTQRRTYRERSWFKRDALRLRSFRVFILSALLLTLLTIACIERDTKLTIKGKNPPSFVMSGSGTLGSLRVLGPSRQREVYGEDASVYWMIKPEPEADPKAVETLSPITYGRVPPGYVQVYPEQGEAPPLVERETYFIDISTNGANGVRMNFTLQNQSNIHFISQRLEVHTRGLVDESLPELSVSVDDAALLLTLEKTGLRSI